MGPNRPIRKPPTQPRRPPILLRSNSMRRFAAILAVCFTAFAQQAMTVDQLSKFLHSATHEMKGKQSDQEIAQFLARIRLTERLDDDTLEQIQSEGVGSKTIVALRALR